MEERLQKLESEVLGGRADLKEAMNEKEKQLKATQNRLAELRQCFECLVCKSAATFPAIISPCCQVVIGCKSCIAQWLETNPACPHCRESITMEECSRLPFIRNLQQNLSDTFNDVTSAIELD